MSETMGQDAAWSLFVAIVKLLLLDDEISRKINCNQKPITVNNWCMLISLYEKINLFYCNS